MSTVPLPSAAELMSAPLTLMTSMLARNEGHRAGYKEGALWAATLLLDRACDVKEPEARAVLQKLAREMLTAVNKGSPTLATEPEPLKKKEEV